MYAEILVVIFSTYFLLERMSGPDTTNKLKEFKDLKVPYTASNLSISPSRRGRDVLGMYPGQIGRVHIACSQGNRTKPASSAIQSQLINAVKRACSFDLQTLRNVQLWKDMYRTSSKQWIQTTYQEAFSFYQH